MKKGTFWTEARVKRLTNYMEQYSSHSNKYNRISKRFRSAVSPNAVYKKLGRMGLLKANWCKSIKNTRKRSLR